MGRESPPTQRAMPRIGSQSTQTQTLMPSRCANRNRSKPRAGAIGRIQITTYPVPNPHHHPQNVPPNSCPRVQVFTIPNENSHASPQSICVEGSGLTGGWGRSQTVAWRGPPRAHTRRSSPAPPLVLLLRPTPRSRCAAPTPALSDPCPPRKP